MKRKNFFKLSVDIFLKAWIVKYFKIISLIQIPKELKFASEILNLSVNILKPYLKSLGKFKKCPILKYYCQIYSFLSQRCWAN